MFGARCRHPTAHAQTDRRFGLVIAFPASVGFEWQAADRFASGLTAVTVIQASSRIRRPPSSCPPGLPTVIRFPVYEIRRSTSNQGADLGVSLLFDVHRSDDLRLYLAPRSCRADFETEIETTITGLTPATWRP